MLFLVKMAKKIIRPVKDWDARERWLDEAFKCIKAYFELMRSEKAEKGRTLYESAMRASSLLKELETRFDDFIDSFVVRSLPDFLEQGISWFNKFKETLDHIIGCLETAEIPKASEFGIKLDEISDRFNKIHNEVLEICGSISESKTLSPDQKDFLSKRISEVLSLIIEAEDLVREVRYEAQRLSEQIERFEQLFEFFISRGSS